MISEEELKTLKENPILNKLLSHLQQQEKEIAVLNREINKIQSLLNGELDKKLSSILEQKINEIINKFAP